MTDEKILPGQSITIDVDRVAHGGEGVGRHGGRVVFVRGALPGERVVAQVSKVKKNFARAEAIDIVTASSHRVAPRCPAAAHGAGCCDFAYMDPGHEVELKASILKDQLSRIGRMSAIPEIEVHDLPPHEGWRTRVRLGVDSQGRAGVRKLRSNDMVTDQVCVQPVRGLIDALVGPMAPRFTPGSEVVAVMDDKGHRHVVEVARPSRGHRAESVVSTIEGSGMATHVVGSISWDIPVASFWQPHTAAPEAYSRFVGDALASLGGSKEPLVAWDLYGGAGMFVPAIVEKLGASVHSVELSPGSAEAGRTAVTDAPVTFHSGTVEKVIPQLPSPDVVVLDPPRAGAGDQVIDQIVEAQPTRVVHVGCDPATFARDVARWRENGYEVTQLALFNAFPGTHHFETIAVLVRQ